ncbi:MAG: ABC transporter ATP-binding protein [Eubacteriales bacterium]|nr:ABC transporter ATP-binding protein [Eubacteriales bacterium]
MNTENAIEVRNMKKKFKVYFDKGHMLKECLIFANRNKHEDRWVLNGVSFDIKKGEAVGLIGKNGCGKSTTLKLLNRIIYPNEGTVEINGKVSSLIELGAGFHEDMTGRENIYINASIFGLTKKEIDERLDDIIRFSELEEYIDNPVRTYSSGMYMRLAFSVAINVDADVLLIDEILAVGDVNFQEKCFQKLRDVKRNGTTIVIVSHALSQVEKICDRAIWIEKGLIKEDGAPREICKKYLESMEYDRLERAEQEYVMQKKEEEEKKLQEKAEREQKRKEEEKARQQEIEKKKQEEEKKKKDEQKRKLNLTCRDICKQCGPDARREGTGEVVFTKVRLLNGDREECQKFKTGDEMIIEIEYEKKVDTDIKGSVSVCITRADWIYCAGFSVKLENGKEIPFKNHGTLELKINELTLLKEKYMLDFIIETTESKLDTLYSLVQFEVETFNKHSSGVNIIAHSWNMDGKKVEQMRYESEEI